MDHMLLIHSLDDGYLGCFHFGTTRNIMYRFLCRHTLSFLFFFLTIFKVFIEFVTILLLFYVLVFWRRGMWDPSSPTRDRIHTPCIGRRSPSHWTTREVPHVSWLYTEEGIAGSCGSPMFNLLTNCKLFSWTAAPFYVFISNVQGSQFLPSSLTFVIIFLDPSILNGFDLHFLNG